MTSDDREYICSVTLIVLGKELEPAHVSSLLKLRPSRTWRRGSPKTATGPLHAWGGWKKFPPASIEKKSLEAQLRYWVKTLTDKTGTLRKLGRLGNDCSLDCFIATDATASIIVPTELQRAISSLALDLRISFFAHHNQP